MGVALGAPPARLLDVGSGAGIPGLVLAARWSSTRIVLLESSRARVTALLGVIGQLGWAERVEVAWDRAESRARRAGWRMAFPAVAARSFGPPAVTAECGGAFVEVGGRLVVSDPPDTPAGRWPDSDLGDLGLRVERREQVGEAHFTVLIREAPLAEEFPRRVGVPARRPRWR